MLLKGEAELMSSGGTKRRRPKKRIIVENEYNTVENDCSVEVLVGEVSLTKPAADRVTKLSSALNSDFTQSQLKKMNKFISREANGGETEIISEDADKGEESSQGGLKSRKKRKKSKKITENSDKGLLCSVGAASLNGHANKDSICDEPSTMVRVGGLQSSRVMNNSSSDCPALISLEAEKSGEEKKVKKRKKKIVKDIGTHEPLGVEEMSLLLPAQCLNLEPEATLFSTSRVACEGKIKKKEPRRILTKVVKNDVQGDCIIHSSAVAEIENLDLEPVSESVGVESTSGETNLSQKGKRKKMRRENIVGSDSRVHEPPIEEHVSLQCPAKCMSSEPESPISHTGNNFCSGSKTKDHGKKLKKEIECDPQDNCTHQALVIVEMEPLLEAVRLESTRGVTRLYKRRRRKEKRVDIVGSDSAVPEDLGEDGKTFQLPAPFILLENEVPISCVDTSVSVIKTEKEEHGEIIKNAMKTDLQDDCKINRSVGLELDNMGIKSATEAGKGSTCEEIILPQKKKKRRRAKFAACDSAVLVPLVEHITSQDLPECLSLEHDTVVSCVGVGITLEKNMKNEKPMTDEKVAKSDIHEDGEFQHDILAKGGNTELKYGSESLELEFSRQSENGVLKTEDRSGFSKMETVTSTKEKNLLCDHSVIHENAVGDHMYSTRKEPCSLKVEKEEFHLSFLGKEDSHLSLKRPISSHPKKKLLILDVNGLLADIVSCPDKKYKSDSMISGKAVFKRPFCEDFLQFCFDRFNVGIWSSRLMKNVQAAVYRLMSKKLRLKLLFCWDQRHCTRTRFKTIENSDKPLVLKELKKLWEKRGRGLPWEKGEYDESNTLLVDDSPYKALRNPKNTAIFPYPYKYTDTNDSALGPRGDIRCYLEGLALTNDVQEYVALNPFGQPSISESDPSWSLYRRIVEGHM